MSSSVAVKGDQRPRVELVPSSVDCQADDAAFFASSYGLTPDPWQLHVLEGWLAERSDGKWAGARAGLAVPRQNGKNAVLEIRELYGIVALGERFLHTAHEVKTARKAFQRLSGFFDNERQWPELAALVKEIRRTNGQEAIVLTNGGSVEFVARSRGSGRGYTVDVLVCDEAQELTDEHLEALLPTISSAPTGNPQTILTGTPPPPGSTAEVFARMRSDAHSEASDRLVWHEWSAGEDYDPDDPEEWARNNPSLGARLHEEVVLTEREQMSDDGFARERLGVWDTNRRHAVIDPDLWASLADGQSEPGEVVAFAVDIPPERKSAAIAIASLRADGVMHVELTEKEKNPGTAWVPDRLVELVARWGGSVVLDPASPAGSLIPALTRAGVEPILIGTRELTQGCGAFYDLVAQKKLRHLNQAPLNIAVDAGRKRSVGDSWAWHRRDTSADISPLVAATLAAHQASKAPTTKKRSGRAAFY